jgi:hypothetical protein
LILGAAEGLLSPVGQSPPPGARQFNSKNRRGKARELLSVMERRIFGASVAVPKTLGGLGQASRRGAGIE